MWESRSPAFGRLVLANPRPLLSRAVLGWVSQSLSRAERGAQRRPPAGAWRSHPPANPVRLSAPGWEAAAAAPGCCQAVRRAEGLRVACPEIIASAQQGACSLGLPRAVPPPCHPALGAGRARELAGLVLGLLPLQPPRRPDLVPPCGAQSLPHVRPRGPSHPLLTFDSVGAARQDLRALGWPVLETTRGTTWEWLGM